MAEVTSLRVAREALGLSQQELGERLGVYQSYVSMVEGGHRTPSLPVAHRWAETLELDVDRFCDLLKKEG